jgi:long-chain fatty acid transport protein
MRLRFRSTRYRVVFALALAVLCGASSRPASASSEDVFGFGARSGAMGAAGSAVGQGYEAVYGNPALLSLAHERELTLGFLGAHFDLRAGDRISYEGLRGSFIGAVLPVPFGGALKDRVTIGLGFFAPFDLIVRGRILYPETPQFLIADRTQTVAVQAAVGVHVWEGLRIGGGFAALAALTGSVLVATDASGRVGTVVEDTLVASYGPIVGASYDIGDAYRIGLAFRGELVGRFNVVITVQDLGGIVVPPLNISGVAQYDPWQIALEAARIKGPWKIAVGATFKRWSVYPGPVEATVRCPETDPATGMPFEGTCGALVPAGPDYSDTIVPRVGVERSLELRPGLRAHLRGGYFFEPTPSPEQTGVANLFDNSRSVVTLGYGLELGPPLPDVRIDWFGQVHVLHPRTHTKDASVPVDNLGAPSVETSGVIVAGGMTAGVRF